MICCLNPECNKPLNPDEQTHCQNCGQILSSLLNKHYKVINRLGIGGFSVTYLAEDLDKFRERCVVKQLHYQSQGKWEKQRALELFEQEAKHLQQLSSNPQIPALLAYFSEENHLYLVQQFIEGQDLSKELSSQGIFNEVQIRELLLDLLPILKFIHAHQVVHRDIKPANIMRRIDGKLALIDFGVAKILDPANIPNVGTVIGSQGYASGEQMRYGRASSASDLFSLGATCFNLLTKIPPYALKDGWVRNWQQYLQQPMSQEMTSVLNKLLQTEEGDRYQSADEVLRDLSAILPTSLPIEPTSTSDSYPTLSPTLIVNRPPSVPPEIPTVVRSNPLTAASTTVAMTSQSPQELHQSREKMNRKRFVWAGILGLSTLALLMGVDACRKHTTNPTPISPQPQPISDSKCSQDTLVKKSGNLYGVIEVGSKGIKGEVIQQLDAPNQDGFKFIAREEEIEERNANAVEPSAQPDAVSAVEGMYDEIQQRFSIPCEQIVIYGSSGVAQKAPHKDALAAEIQKKTGRSMQYISVEDEAKFGFDGVVPEWRRNDVIFIDIGSGNTKGAYLENAQKNQHVTFAVPFGTETFTKKINESQGNSNFTKAAEEAKIKVLAPQIKNEIQKKPGMQNLSRVYLAGGISWALATLLHPCEQEQAIQKKEERVARYLRLSAEDINTFYYNATRARKTLFEPNLSACSPEQRQKVQKDISKIQRKVFSGDNLIAGAEILRAFSKELQFSEKERIFFARYAIEALPIGYLMQQLERSTEEATK